MTDGKLREGVTTGTCAAAAALASVIWQKNGKCPEAVEVETPIGRRLRLMVVPDIFPRCCVVKDAGDDPDVTHGCRVCAEVFVSENDGDILFSGGEGVGTVTAPGLKLPVGEPAINPVPRQMICDHLRRVIGSRSATVRISVPGGQALAAKTFNPRLGIVGGISILGTTGIVRPMSEEAVRDSLSLELQFRLAQTRHVVFVPGQTAEKAIRSLLGCSAACVQISNYAGYMLDEALRMGAQTVLIAGFAGKLVKLAADIMNTHSHVADGRREILCTYAALNGASAGTVRELFECRTVQEAIAVVKKQNLEMIWPQIAEAARGKCCLRTGNRMEIGVLLLDGDGRVLGGSDRVRQVIERVTENRQNGGGTDVI